MNEFFTAFENDETNFFIKRKVAFEKNCCI